MTPLRAIAYLWIGWLVSWMAAAFWTNRTVARPPFREELGSRIPIALGAFLLFWDWEGARVPPAWLGWSMFGVVLAGLLFAWWARLHLGRLWSGHVTRKEGHRIVDTGPYAIVRHPIYTGVIASVLATAIAQERWLALSGGLLIALAFGMRARTEERFLRRELGAELYEAYARRVPMLIPFAPVKR